MILSITMMKPISIILTISQTVKQQCELAGIPAERITIDQTCTYVNPDGFSYRQDKQSGRHMSFVMRKGD